MTASNSPVVFHKAVDPYAVDPRHPLTEDYNIKKAEKEKLESKPCENESERQESESVVDAPPSSQETNVTEETDEVVGGQERVSDSDSSFDEVQSPRKSTLQRKSSAPRHCPRPITTKLESKKPACKSKGKKGCLRFPCSIPGCER
ncbi:hypothetical protein FRC17_007745, partial [Serendipita sp. 399]